MILCSGLAFSLLLLLPAASAATINSITLTSPNPSIFGNFGSSVAVGNGIVGVGANGDSGFTGKVYIYNTSGSLTNTLSSPSGQEGSGFGSSVSISGSTVVVGAPSEKVAGSYYVGQAYIFSTAGALVVTLTSPNAQPGGLFGYSVSVSGSTVVVGAPGELAGGVYNAGHVYVYNTSGSLLATLASPNPESGHDFGASSFGFSVAVSGRSIVVGAGADTVPGLSKFTGHAYVFNTEGSLTATLTSPNAQSGGEFGDAVAISGKRIIVGAPSESAAGVPYAGRAYVFNTKGSLVSTLTSPNGGSFGVSVAVSGGNVIVGEFANGGHAYIFTTKGSLVANLTSPNAQAGGYGYGFSVAVKGNNLVVGAYGEAVSGIYNAGHAYLYSLVDDNSEQEGSF